MDVYYNVVPAAAPMLIGMLQTLTDLSHTPSISVSDI